MKKILYAALLMTGMTGFALCVGCSDDGKRAEPKLAPGETVDPRLKPAGAGSGGAGEKPQPQTKPQENKGQDAVKGD